MHSSNLEQNASESERRETDFAPSLSANAQPNPSSQIPQMTNSLDYYGDYQTGASSSSGLGSGLPPQGYPQRGLTKTQQQTIWKHQSKIELQRRKERLQQEAVNKLRRREEFQRLRELVKRDNNHQGLSSDTVMMVNQPGSLRMCHQKEESLTASQPGVLRGSYQTRMQSPSYQPGMPTSVYQQHELCDQRLRQQQMYRQQQAQQLQTDPRMLPQPQLQQQQQLMNQGNYSSQPEPMDHQSYLPQDQSSTDPPRMTLQEHALMMQRQRQLQIQQQAAYQRQQQQRACQQQHQVGGVPSSRNAYLNPLSRSPNEYIFQQQQNPQGLNAYPTYQHQTIENHKRQELVRQQQNQQMQVQGQQSLLQTQNQYQQSQAGTPGSSYVDQATPGASQNFMSLSNTSQPSASTSVSSRRVDVTDVVEGELDQFNDILFMTDFGEKPLPPVTNDQQMTFNDTKEVPFTAAADEISNALAAIHSSDEMMQFSNLAASDPSALRPVEKLADFLNTRPLRPTAIFGARPNPWRPAGPELDVEIPEPFPDDKETAISILQKMLAATVIKPTSFDIHAACNITMQPPQNPRNWCHIHYYEFAERHGEPFKASGDDLIIDGQCAPSTPTRLCIGNIGNPSRDPVAVAARRQIGRGCRITRNLQDLVIESLSDAAIFVQAPIHAECRGDHYNTVYRLSKGQNMRLFDYEFFNKVLQNAVKTSDYDTVYKVQNMCHIRMSFVKGWGGCYRREQIHYTPCWIEVHLTFPLLCVDRCLCTMKQTPPPDAQQEAL